MRCLGNHLEDLQAKAARLAEKIEALRAEESRLMRRLAILDPGLLAVENAYERRRRRSQKT